MLLPEDKQKINGFVHLAFILGAYLFAIDTERKASHTKHKHKIWRIKPMKTNEMNPTVRTLNDETTLNEVYYTMTEGCSCFGISPDFLLELFGSRKQN